MANHWKLLVSGIVRAACRQNGLGVGWVWLGRGLGVGWVWVGRGCGLGMGEQSVGSGRTIRWGCAREARAQRAARDDEPH